MFCQGRGEPLNGYHYCFLVLFILGLMNFAFWTGFATANLKNKYENMKNQYEMETLYANLKNQFGNRKNRTMEPNKIAESMKVREKKFVRRFAREKILKRVNNEGKEPINDERLQKSVKENLIGETDRLKMIQEKVQSKIENEDFPEQIEVQNNLTGNGKNFEVKLENGESNDIYNTQTGRQNRNLIHEEENGYKQRNGSLQNGRNSVETAKLLETSRPVVQNTIHSQIGAKKEEFNNDSSKSDREARTQNEQNQETSKKDMQLPSETHFEETQKENTSNSHGSQNKEKSLGTLHTDEIIKQLPLINMDDLEENRADVTVVIFVMSSPHSIDRRHAIRETWWTMCQQPLVSFCQ